MYRNHSKKKFKTYKVRLNFVNTKSQAAMEFLMTYGWAFLIVLIVISSLVYFGVLNPNQWIPDKVDLSNKIEVTDISVDQNSITLLLRNNAGSDISGLYINVTECGDGKGSASDAIRIPAGKTSKVRLHCVHDYDIGTKLYSDIDVKWDTKTSTKGETFEFDHSATGMLKVNVNRGSMDTVLKVERVNTMTPYYNRWFNYTVNVSCLGDDCGEINVSIDPAVGDTGTATLSDGGDWYDFDTASSVSNGDTEGDLWKGDGCCNFGPLNGALQVNTGVATASWDSVECGPADGRTYTTVVIPFGTPYSQIICLKTVNDIYVKYKGQASCCGSITLDWEITSLGEKTGLISTVSGTKPFWTNATSNPLTINLESGESQLVTFWINTTGFYNTTHEFFAYANITSNMSISNETDHINLTITESFSPEITLVSPASQYNLSNDVIFQFNVSDYSGINSCSLYIDGLLNYTDNASTDSTNSYTSSIDNGNYNWSIFCTDLAGNVGNTTNRTLLVNSTKLDVDLIYPPAVYSLDRYDVFNVTVNVTCLLLDCGNVNTTLAVKGRSFIEYLGGSSNDFSYSVIETSDESIVTIGYTGSYGAGGNDLILSKFDKYGVEQWTKTLGGSGTDYGRSVIEASDGSLVTLGYTSSYGNGSYDAMLSKFYTNGTKQWTTTLGGTSTEYGYSVIETNDGGYVITGTMRSYGAGSYDMLLSKFNSAGVEQWTKTLGGTGNDYGMSVTETADGSLLVAGYTSSYGAGGYDIMLSKFNSAGVEQWTKTLGGTSSDYGRSVIEASDGSIMVTGNIYGLGAGSNDMFLSKFNSAGVEQWTKTLGSTSSDYGFSVIEASDGSFMVGGYFNGIGAGGYDAFISNFNTAGVEQWTTTFGGASTDYGYSLIETSDKSFILSGTTYNFGSGGYDLFFAKFDSSGDIDHTSVATQTLTEGSASITEQNIAISEASQSVNKTSPNITEEDQTATNGFIVEDLTLRQTGLPFYVNTTNPNQTTLNAGDSIIISWWLNATGVSSRKYELMVYANDTGTLVTDLENLNVTIN